jgi:multicomponent Na+:H+ antiporter subunit G
MRFPDFYTRMHAVGVTDTLAAGMILIGLMLQNTESLAMLNPESPVRLKLLLILLMTLFIGPTASHALAKAAIRSGLLPLLGNKHQERGVGPSKL